MMAMLRPWVAIAVVACGHGESAPVSEHAGTVTEVAGKVTITHDNRARDARPQDVVEADDMIATGADGHVTIVLAKNDVSWQLGPGRHGRVSESVAWNLPQRDPNPKPSEQDTATAGRPAERSAANTEATAPTTAANNETAPPPPVAAPTPQASPPPKPNTPTKAAATAHASDAKAAHLSQDAADMQKEMLDALDKSPAPAAPSSSPRSLDDALKSTPNAPSSGGGEGAVDVGADRAAITSAKPALAKCFGDAKAPKLTIRIDHDHKVTRIVAAGITLDDATRACLLRVLSGISFSGIDYSVTVTP
jgi:hypothetical protein